LVIRHTINSGVLELFHVTKQRECGAYPPSLGVRSALASPPVPTGNPTSLGKMAKSRHTNVNKKAARCLLRRVT
jgi:hypothetical protein